MTGPAHDLTEAERRATAARDRLSATLAKLQHRLDPKLLAREARDVGTAAAVSGIDGARRNPGLAAGAVGTVALLLARHRIARIFRRKPKRVPAAPINHSASPKD